MNKVQRNLSTICSKTLVCFNCAEWLQWSHIWLILPSFAHQLPMIDWNWNARYLCQSRALWYLHCPWSSRYCRGNAFQGQEWGCEQSSWTFCLAPSHRAQNGQESLRCRWTVNSRTLSRSWSPQLPLQGPFAIGPLPSPCLSPWALL